jgi:hypothetical protein
MLKLTTKKGTKMKQYEKYTTAQLKALLKLEHMKQHRDGITNLMFDDWVTEIYQRTEIPTAEELYERSR